MHPLLLAVSIAVAATSTDAFSTDAVNDMLVRTVGRAGAANFNLLATDTTQDKETVTLSDGENGSYALCVTVCFMSATQLITYSRREVYRMRTESRLGV